MFYLHIFEKALTWKKMASCFLPMILNGRMGKMRKIFTRHIFDISRHLFLFMKMANIKTSHDPCNELNEVHHNLDVDNDKITKTPEQTSQSNAISNEVDAVFDSFP